LRNEPYGTAALVKVFGCRPHDGRATGTGPASANLHNRRHAQEATEAAYVVDIPLFRH
jgi:hypothetical protein